ncbi:hypothetical protein EJ04DRAFT_554059 [Polyplosphaeria fusca]|uniref:Rhodopsin domain-containing protein n=1 Tax=Polyplosphaeria fusca TaxID=682080 RepID=A0A9P4QTJ4_9PLEO|nr:hypothetical protein EJ04DRAFT_554059 [Polyplosphaeria fusca]
MSDSGIDPETILPLPAQLRPAMISNSSWELDIAAENCSQPLLNVCISFAILETFFIIAFIFSWYFNNNNSNNTRAVLRLILAAYIFCFTGIILGILKITLGGAGYHEDTLHPSTVRRMRQLVKAHEVIYVLSIPCPKLAMLCLYFRLFRTKTAHYLLYTTGLIVITTCVFGFISAFANCRPFTAFWNDPQHAHCTMNTMTAFRYYSIPNIVTDVIMLLIPIPALWRLNVGTLVKIGVFLTFVVSTIGIVTAVLRFVSFANNYMFVDITFRSISNISWSIVEPGVYLVAATIPTLRPLVRRMFRELNEVLPVSQILTDRYKLGGASTRADRSPTPQQFQLRREPSRELLKTIGRKPSRTLQLDDYHRAHCYEAALTSPMSMDEKSVNSADKSCSSEEVPKPSPPQPVRLRPLNPNFVFPDVKAHDRRRR